MERNESMRYYRANPTAYYIIGAVAAGIFVVYSLAALSHTISAALSQRKTVSDSNIAVSSQPVESEEPIVAGEEWKLILINAENPLPDGYEKNLELVKLKYDQSVDARICDDLQEMMDACRAAGLHPVVCSGYRSIQRQQKLFNQKLNEYLDKGYSQKEAYALAAELVAVPGTSEHNSGLAVDIVAQSYQFLDNKQELLKEQEWLRNNSWQYGFVQRYPSDKKDITGIVSEPWHYRYVGKKAAKYMKEYNLCLEEYLQETGITQAAQTTQTTAASAN